MDLAQQLEAFRRESNRRANDVDILLTLQRGQIEVDPADLDPYVDGAVLLKESVIARLNNDIGVRIKLAKQFT